MPDLKVLLSRETIAKRVAEMGAEIARDFHGQSIIFVGVLKGAAIFLSDLARQVPLDATFDFIGVSSYGNRPTAKEDPAGHAAWDSLGEVRLTKDMDQSLADRNVILVEDILDTGLTLNYISKLVAGASTPVAAHCRLARQAFAPQTADPGAIHRLHDSRCLTWSATAWTMRKNTAIFRTSACWKICRLAFVIMATNCKLDFRVE